MRSEPGAEELEEPPAKQQLRASCVLDLLRVHEHSSHRVNSMILELLDVSRVDAEAQTDKRAEEREEPEPLFKSAIRASAAPVALLFSLVRSLASLSLFLTQIPAASRLHRSESPIALLPPYRAPPRRDQPCETSSVEQSRAESGVQRAESARRGRRQLEGDRSNEGADRRASGGEQPRARDDRCSARGRVVSRCVCSSSPLSLLLSSHFCSTVRFLASLLCSCD